MRKISKWILGLLILALSACSTTNSNQSQALSSNDYAAILPYDTKDTRVKHVGIIPDINTRIQLEDGLMDLSKQYFPPDRVGYKTHAFLDYDELDATDGSRGLLGTLRDDNPNGLNPGVDEAFDTGNGTVKNAIILVDIYELDWYSNDELQGISIALVVNDMVGDDVKIKEDRMQQYLEVTCSKLVNYMRQRFNEVTSNVPIFVAAYELNSEETEQIGGYKYAGYFQGSNQNFYKINEEWIHVPSGTFTTKDLAAAEEFTDFKSQISQVLSDNTYVTAEAKYEDDELVKMNIEITAHGKTAGEILAVIEATRVELKNFSNTNCRYTVRIFNDSDAYCMMVRNVGTQDVIVASSF